MNTSSPARSNRKAIFLMALVATLAAGASGCAHFLDYVLFSASLPGGMSLSSAGVLAGMPVGGGTFPFTVKVTDQDAPPRSKTRDLSLRVNNPVPVAALLLRM